MSNSQENTPKKKRVNRRSKKSKPQPELLLAAIGEPMGACVWVDNIGQNHCTVTTQSQCSKLPKSKFYAGKRCPGGM
jgi:hypothetical protein